MRIGAYQFAVTGASKTILLRSKGLFLRQTPAVLSCSSFPNVH